MNSFSGHDGLWVASLLPGFRLRCLAGGLSLCLALTAHGDPAGPEISIESIGNGDGRIHVIPSLSAPSVENGGKLVVSAVVKSQEPVARVEADLGGLARVELRARPVAGAGMLPGGGHAGVYEAEWTAKGLDKQVYTVALTVTDANGYSFTDRSLQFPDPASGPVKQSVIGSPSTGMWQAGTLHTPGEERLTCAVVDTTNGYAYFGTNTSPGRVIKVSLGSGVAAPARVGAVTLETGEDLLLTAVIDAANGYAYFGTVTSPGRVVKVSLGAGASAPSRVDAATLEPGEDSLRSAVIDAANGYAYFGTNTSPGMVVKVSLGAGVLAPSRVGALTLNAGEDSLLSAVADTVNGYGYFGTNTSPGRVVKVSLGSGASVPSRVGAVTLDTGENGLQSAVIDAANAYAYFGTNTNPGRVVKVSLGSGAAVPTRTGAVTLNAGENILRSAVIDAVNGYAYFGVSASPGRVVKVSLGSGAAAPTRTGAVTLNSGENTLRSAVIDLANGYAYFGTDTVAGRVVKVSLGSGSAAPSRTGAVTLVSGENTIPSAVIDAVNGYAYFGTDSSPGIVIKVSLGAGAAVPTRVGAVTLNAGENGLKSGVIDAANGYAYFGTSSIPGRVVKVALGAGASAPTRVGALTFNMGEDDGLSAVIDAANGYAYFGTRTSPGKVIKVSLGAGASAPTRVGDVTLNAGEDFLNSAVIDTANGYAYFGTLTSPGRVVKVALGAGVAAPSRVGAVTLNTGEESLVSAVIDAANGYAYFGTYTSPGRVVKVSLGAGAAAPSRVGAVTLSAGEEYLLTAAIDAAKGYAYFGGETSPGRVVKVALGSGASAPSRFGALTLNAGDEFQTCAVLDTANGYAYFGTDTFPGRIPYVFLSRVSVQDDFTTGVLAAPGSVNGWSSFGFNSALAFAEYSVAAGAYRGNVAASANRFRISGVMANLSEWLPYTQIGKSAVVRAKYYMYAGGQANPSDLNQIPNLRMRLSNRFAVNSMAEVFHHTGDNPTQTAMDQEMRPSTVATSPSLYRVDFDPVDVPYLAANAGVEGVTRAFEAYAIYPSDQGYVAMTESVIGTYPATFISTAAVPSKVYDAVDLAVYNAPELSLVNLIAGTQEGEFGTADTLTPQPTHAQGAGGITLDTGAVPTDRIGLASREFNPDRNTNNYPARVRVAEGRQYAIRWHLTSTQQVNKQAQIRLRARSAKFAWSQKFEIGGAWGTGGAGLYPLNANNSIAQESVPGVGTQNPDKYTTDTAGGWYTMILHTPLSADIRPEFAPGTPITTRMPNLSAQPGPGVNAFSRRDVFLGLDLVDSISGGAGRNLEQGNVTVDRVEIRTYNLVPD